MGKSALAKVQLNSHMQIRYRYQNIKRMPFVLSLKLMQLKVCFTKYIEDLKSFLILQKCLRSQCCIVSYPEHELIHVSIIYDQFREVHVLGVRFISKRCRGKHSSAVRAYWPSIGGSISSACRQLRVGVVKYFVRHTVTLSSPQGKQEKVNFFAFVHWYLFICGRSGFIHSFKLSRQIWK